MNVRRSRTLLFVGYAWRCYRLSSPEYSATDTEAIICARDMAPSDSEWIPPRGTYASIVPRKLKKQKQVFEMMGKGSLTKDLASGGASIVVCLQSGSVTSKHGEETEVLDLAKGDVHFMRAGAELVSNDPNLHVFVATH